MNVVIGVGIGAEGAGATTVFVTVQINVTVAVVSSEAARGTSTGFAAAGAEATAAASRPVTGNVTIMVPSSKISSGKGAVSVTVSVWVGGIDTEGGEGIDTEGCPVAVPVSVTNTTVVDGEGVFEIKGGSGAEGVPETPTVVVVMA